jgi:hypothetical protein
MFNPLRAVYRWLIVDYRPCPGERPFLARAQTQTVADVDVTVAVLSDAESKRFFGIRLSRRGIQPVSIRIVNRTDKPLRLDLFSVDPTYYTALEAAYLNHFSVWKRLVSFGLLGWLFLPLIPLIPFKIISARAANRRMDALFKAEAFRAGPIQPGDERSGFVFGTLDEGMKNLDIRVVATDCVHEYGFCIPVPGLALRPCDDDSAGAQPLENIDERSLRAWLERQPRATTNRWGTVDGDPLNLVVTGDRATILQCFGARWDEVEVITLVTCWKTLRAFLFDAEYRYSPVSALYVDGRSQDLALQKARASINERIHLRLWRTTKAVDGQPVWIGQISRDIGVRFTATTWNLTTHRIDPDTDEARDYAIDSLSAAGRVARAGYVSGVGEAPSSAPRHNLTGDPYFTDGLRAVVFLSKNRTQASFFS